MTLKKNTVAVKVEQSDLDSYWEYEKKAAAYEKKISDRIYHILKYVYPKAFDGFKLSWWDYSTYYLESEEEGTLSYAWRGDSINLRSEWSKEPHEYGDLLSNYICNFPVSYLTSSDEDIENELKDMLVRAKEEEGKAAAKKKKEEVKQAALSKLSDEERKALGFK